MTINGTGPAINYMVSIKVLVLVINYLSLLLLYLFMGEYL